MIAEGDITLIDNLPYNCIKIEGGTAFLKMVGEEKRGRFRKMDVKMVPYLDENKNLIVPKAKPFSRRRMLRFDYMKVIKENVNMGVSHDLPYWIAEWLENLVIQLADKAEQNAIDSKSRTINAGHWYWFEVGPTEGLGHWPQQVEYAKDYKEYLRDEQNKPKEEE